MFLLYTSLTPPPPPQEHLIKDMVAANFTVEFFVSWLKAKDMSSLKATLKKGQLESRWVIPFTGVLGRGGRHWDTRDRRGVEFPLPL